MERLFSLSVDETDLVGNVMRPRNVEHEREVNNPACTAMRFSRYGCDSEEFVAWYEAFDIAPEGAMYLALEERVKIG